MEGLKIFCTSWTYLSVRNHNFFTISCDLQTYQNYQHAQILQNYDFQMEEPIAKIFYNVNYINVNYTINNSNVDCKYLLFLKVLSLD